MSAEIACARLWYAPHLERMREDATVRQADLLQLEQIAAGYPSRERFLSELTLDPAGRHAPIRPACRCWTRTI